MRRVREGTEARAVRIIYSTLSCGMRKLLDRRQDLTSKFFNDIMNNENHKLYDLLPSKNFSNYDRQKEGIFKGLNSRTGIETVLFRIILPCIIPIR